jgi:hypothetical protein
MRRASPPALLLGCLLAAGFAGAQEQPPEGPPPPPVRGRAVIAGQAFDLRYAWLIRGPDAFEPGRLDTYVVMAPDDISAELARCPTVKCAIWDVLKNGVILEPEKDGGFWIRALHPKLAKEQQLSARGWAATIDRPERIAGSVRWEPQGQDPPILDLTIDATLLKSFPLRQP